MFSTSCQPLDCGNWFLLDLSQLCVLGHWQSARQAEQLPMIQTSHLFCGNDALSLYSGLNSSCLKGSYTRVRSSGAHPVVSSSFWPIGIKKIRLVSTLQLFTNCQMEQKGSWSLSHHFSSRNAGPGLQSGCWAAEGQPFLPTCQPPMVRPTRRPPLNRGTAQSATEEHSILKEWVEAIRVRISIVISNGFLVPHTHKNL